MTEREGGFNPREEVASQVKSLIAEHGAESLEVMAAIGTEFSTIQAEADAKGNTPDAQIWAGVERAKFLHGCGLASEARQELGDAKEYAYQMGLDDDVKIIEELLSQVR